MDTDIDVGADVVGTDIDVDTDSFHRGGSVGVPGGSGGFRAIFAFTNSTFEGVPLQRLSLFKILKWEYGHPRPGQPRPEPLPLSRNLEAMWARCDATW